MTGRDARLPTGNILTYSSFLKTMINDSPEKRAMLIMNPKAGTRSKRGVPDYVTDMLGEAGIRVDYRPTTGAGDARAFAREAAGAGYDVVIAAGGDGTVNETASGLCGSQTALGIIPLGSGNGLARSLDIPSDLRYATKVIERGNVAVCDHGVVNGHDFFCTFGVGFDAEVSRRFAAEKHRGKTVYVKNVFREFLKYSPEAYAISIGGMVITERAFLIAVCNAQQYGNNAYIAPGAKVDDGLLDVTVVHAGSMFKNALVGVDLLTGYLDRNTLIESFRVSSATITRLNEGPAHVDGEPMTLGKVLEIECRPASLRIIVPEKGRQFRPLISPALSFFDDLRYDLRAALGIK